MNETHIDNKVAECVRNARIYTTNHNVWYIMGRMASGKGHILPMISKNIQGTKPITTIVVSDIVAQIIKSNNRAKLQSTAHLDQQIFRMLRDRTLEAIDLGFIVLIDGIRQLQILVAMQASLGGSAFWIDATNEVREIRYNMRNANQTEKDGGVSFKDADQRDIDLGASGLEFSLRYMSGVHFIANPLSLSEIRLLTDGTQKVAASPKTQSTEQPAAPVDAETVPIERTKRKYTKKVKVVETPVDVEVTETKLVDDFYKTCVVNTPLHSYIHNNSGSAPTSVHVRMTRANNTDTNIRITTRAPKRLVGPNGKTATVRAIEKAANTSIAIMQDVDGYKLFSKSGTIGISLKSFLIGPNFHFRKEDVSGHNFAVEAYNARPEPVQANTFICMHCPGVKNRPVAISFYDVEEYAVITRPIPTDPQCDWVEYIKRFNIENIPELFNDWQRMTVNKNRRRN